MPYNIVKRVEVTKMF